jgi:hypothetical protein
MRSSTLIDSFSSKSRAMMEDRSFSAAAGSSSQHHHHHRRHHRHHHHCRRGASASAVAVVVTGLLLLQQLVSHVRADCNFNTWCVSTVCLYYVTCRLSNLFVRVRMRRFVYSNTHLECRVIT